jgi:hypothetical protein
MDNANVAGLIVSKSSRNFFNDSKSNCWFGWKKLKLRHFFKVKKKKTIL